MQSVSADFTAEEKDSVRKIAHNLLVSWKKETTVGNRTFTIGVSTIQGNDVIGINPGAVGSPGNYRYFDESAYVMGMAWERQLSFPRGGLTKALAEAELANTTGRFLPDYMGGNSELHTAILPRRPAIISAGFNFNGIDQTLPQFAGVLDRPPAIDYARRSVKLHMADYVDFFANRYVDQEEMFTGLRTDQAYERMLQNLGFSTAQYELDVGLNTIPFGIFEKGTRIADIFHDLAEAENGHFYQDEQGVFRFENRQHWDNAPYTEVQRVISTPEVINIEAPNYDHIVNVVEVKSQIRKKQVNQIIYTLGAPIELPANADTEFFVDFEDPILEMDTPTLFEANTNIDGSSGTDITGTVSLSHQSVFSQAAKLTFTNTGLAGYLTKLTITGRPAKKVGDLYYRDKDDSSRTAYEERPLVIENKYIQDASWAESYALMILQDFAEPDSVQEMTIKAIPELQQGDLISWQGRTWRIFGLRTHLNPSLGFLQDLLIFRRNVRSFFRIGISTIGSIDGIAP